MTVMLRVMKGLRPARPSPEQALELSAEIWEVMERCWSHSPAERPSVDRVAERLFSIPPMGSTLRRMRLRKLERKQAVGVDALTPLSFRAAMRGQNTTFSDAEIKLLQEITGVSSQSFDSNISPLGADASTHSLPDAAVNGVAGWGVDNYGGLNESWATRSSDDLTGWGVSGGYQADTIDLFETGGLDWSARAGWLAEPASWADDPKTGWGWR